MEEPIPHILPEIQQASPNGHNGTSPAPDANAMRTEHAEGMLSDELDESCDEEA
jgi:hypothetical protein